MAIFGSKRRKRRTSTPVLSSDAAARVKERTQRAWERDVNNMVRERSVYRLLWPVMLILLTALNVILAGDYMIRIADAGGGVVWLGLTRNELINWLIAFGLIVTGRILVVLLGDDQTRGAEAWIGRIGVRLVITGLIGFSIWTAAAETATKLQTKVDRGDAAAAHVVAAGAVADTSREALEGAKADLMAARADLATAQRRAREARAEKAGHIADARQRYAGDPAAYGWVTRAEVMAKFDADIASADVTENQTRRRIDAMQQTVSSARAQMVDAQRDRAEAAQAPGSEGTVIEAFGAMIPSWLGGPWPVAITIAVWGWIAAILLEVVCFAGAGATGRILREALTSHDEARGGMADAIRREAAAQAARNTPTASAPMSERINPSHDMRPDAPSSAPDGDIVDLTTRIKYADKIADAIADARSGLLTDASYPTIKTRYRVAQGGADAIRNALLDQGLFMQGSGGTLVKVA